MQTYKGEHGTGDFQAAWNEWRESGGAMLFDRADGYDEWQDRVYVGTAEEIEELTDDFSAREMTETCLRQCFDQTAEQVAELLADWVPTAREIKQCQEADDADRR